MKVTKNYKKCKCGITRNLDLAPMCVCKMKFNPNNEKQWTQAEIDTAISMRRLGIGYEKISTRLGRSPRAIKNKVEKVIYKQTALDNN